MRKGKLAKQKHPKDSRWVYTGRVGSWTLVYPGG